MGKVEDRHKKYIALLKANGTMKRSDLWTLADSDKATLSEDLKKLRALGYRFSTPPRSGQITLVGEPSSSSRGEDIPSQKSKKGQSGPADHAFSAKGQFPPSIFGIASAFEPYTKLSPSQIRCWTILFLLRNGELERKEIMRAYVQFSYDHEVTDRATLDELMKPGRKHPASYSTLTKDLTWLVNHGFVSMRKLSQTEVYYKPTLKCSVFCNFDRSTIREFQTIRSLLSEDKVSTQELDDINEKLSVLTKQDAEEDPSSTFGKQNIISAVAKKNLFELTQLPYKSHLLDIKYTNKNGDAVDYEVSCGLIFYSQETGQLYLLGREQSPSSQKQSGFLLLSLEKILSVRVKHELTKDFLNQSQKVYDLIFKEMFATDISGREYVKIRFDNKPYLLDQLRMLEKNRSDTAKITIDASTDTFIYEDTIRGQADFRRYLRTFGPYYVIEESTELPDDPFDSAPPERPAAEGSNRLAEEMIASAGRIAALYKERFENV